MIDVVSTHPRGPAVSALLVELDPALVAFARNRAAAAGVANRVRVVEGDASLSRWYVDGVPADLVLVCGVFGNISSADIRATSEAMRGFCGPRGHLVWTRHRRPPDATPAIRADLAAAGFTEVAFVAPEGTVMTVGHHRLDGPTKPFDPDQVLFDFVGDGFAPAIADDHGPDAGPAPDRDEHVAGAGSQEGPESRSEPHFQVPITPGPPHVPSGLERSEPGPDRHPLHPAELVTMAWRTGRLEPARVLVPGRGDLLPRCVRGHFLH